MKKFNVKKVSFIAIPLLCLIAGIIIFKSISSSSSRIVLKDQAQAERILLHNSKLDHACHCFAPMIYSNPGFEIKDITATSASFRWVCDVEATYQVNYGTTASHGTFVPATRPTVYYKDHTVTVTGLTPNTLYHAQPYSYAKSGGPGIVKTWIMSSNSKKDWTFTTKADVPIVPTYAIGGSILDSTGVGITGVTVKLSGDTAITITTPSTGIYNFTGLKQGKNYVITPTKTSYIFDPESRSYSSLAGDHNADKYLGEKAVSVRRDNNERPFVISNVTVDKVTTTDATITWNTDLFSTSEVEYGTTTKYGSKSGENTELVTYHDIQLFHLKPGATYHFRVISKTAGQVSFKSADFTITTEAFEKRIVDKKDVYIDPNPCASTTEFNYYLKQPIKNLTIDILTLSGKKVAVLEAPLSALNTVGWQRISWDVKDHSGRFLANGLYVYTMRFAISGKEELVRSQFMVRR